MPKGDLSQHSTLFYQLAFGGLFLFIVMAGVKPMMYGSSMNLKLFGAMILGISMVLALDKYYWVLLPLLQTSGINIPGLPFSGFEIGELAVISVYFIRKGIRGTGERPIRLTGELISTFPLVFWIFGMFCVYPCGMNFTGSTMIGGRFYMQIFLAWLTLLVASTWRFDEKSCRVLFFCILFGSSISLVREIFSARISSSSDADQGSAYELIGFSLFYTVMFARYNLSEILSKLWRTAVVGISVILLINSGKRAMMATIVLIPIVKVFLTGRDKLLTLFCAFLGVIGLSVVVMGDLAGMYELPKSAKRALAVVVPSYRSSREGSGMNDKFRELVHGYAIAQIKQSPWIGMKGFAVDRNTLSIMSSRSIGENSYQQHSGHAVARNWHSLVHAYPADFGLPALLFFLIFYVKLLKTTINISWKYLPVVNTYTSAMLTYCSLQILSACFYMTTGGHSALSTQGIFFRFALFIAISNGIIYAKSQTNTNILPTLTPKKSLT